MRSLPGAVLVAVLIFLAVCSPIPAADEGLGFWEINLKDFQVKDPLLVPSPVPGKVRPDMYYIWVFSFKNNNSLEGVKKNLEKIIAHPKVDAARKDALRRTLAKVDADLSRGDRNIRMFISLHTDTGKTNINVSDLIMRNVAEKRYKRKLLTIDEIARGNFAPDEEIWAVATFREVDVEADAFEIRVGGLGKRINPSYYPGFIVSENLPYEAKMRKVVRFFYSRPGSAGYRQASPLKLKSRSNDWIWMWDTEVYPAEVKEVNLSRTVETGKGEKELVWNYRYFYYDIFNSTALPQDMTVVKVGLSPRIEWQGLEFNIDMAESGNDKNYRKRQAIKLIDPEKEVARRHIEGEIAPGMKAVGLAVVEKGISNIDVVLTSVIEQLRLNTLLPEDMAGPLVLAYRNAVKGTATTPSWKSLPLPTDAEVSTMIVAQAQADLQEMGIEVSQDDVKAYGKLAAFAVLMNRIVDDKLAELARKRLTPMVMTVVYNGSEETTRFTRLTFGKPVESAIVAEPVNLPKLKVGKK